MAESKSRWPDGLTDLEAATRLQAVLISACEGNRDLSTDRAYKQIRTPLMRRSDLIDAVPSFVKVNRDLGAFWSYIRGVSGQWQPRREHVWEFFKPLFDRIEGRTVSPVMSSKWTGKRSVQQQARVVLSLAPDALHSIEMLTMELEVSLHNGGPIEDEREDALAALRKLHSELGKLLVLAEQGKPVTANLARLRKLKDSSFQWSADTMSLALAGLPLMASSTVLGCGVIFLINALTKGAVDANLVGTAAMAAHAVGASKEK